MPQYDPLVTEWANHTGTPDEKLAAILAMTVPAADRSVPIAEVMDYLRTNNLWLPIKMAAATDAAAAAAVDLNGDLRITNISMNLPIVQGMLGALVASKLLTAEQAAALIEMKTVTIPWWQSVGLPVAPDLGLVEALGLK